MKSYFRSITLLFVFLAFAGNIHAQETDFILHTDIHTGGIQKIMHSHSYGY